MAFRTLICTNLWLPLEISTANLAKFEEVLEADAKSLLINVRSNFDFNVK